MQYYGFLKNNEIVGIGQAKLIQEDIESLSISEEVYNSIEIYGNNYYIYDNGELVLNPEYEKQKAHKKREELDKLILTATDVERALYFSKGIDFDGLKEIIKEKMPEIDMTAINIEFKVANFYRGATLGEGGIRLIDTIGALLGYSSDDMDYLFLNKKLPDKEENKEEAPKEEETGENEKEEETCA